MLRLLRAAQDKSELGQFGPLDIKRFTRVEPRVVRTMNAKAYSRSAVVKSPSERMDESHIAHPNYSSDNLPQTAPPYEAEPNKTPVSLTAQLHSEEAISVALLRRALPLRFLDMERGESVQASAREQVLAKFAFN